MDGQLFARVVGDPADAEAAAGSGTAIALLKRLRTLLANPQSTPAPMATVATGELAGSVAPVQMPNVACAMVRFKASITNNGNVYVGGAGVTRPDGATDTTTGLQLTPGDETGWLPVSNLSVFWRISDNAGDALTYLALG